MLKQNLPKIILALAFCITFILIAGFYFFEHSETKKTKNLPLDFVEPVKIIENNESGDKNNPEPKPTEPISPEEPPLKIYETELFIEAKWGKGEGEVGLLSVPELEVAGNIEKIVSRDFTAQDFAVDENSNLYILDSVNMRVLHYDEKGELVNSFEIKGEGEALLEVPGIKNISGSKLMRYQDIEVENESIYIYSIKERSGLGTNINFEGFILQYTTLGEYLTTHQIPDELEYQDVFGFSWVAQAPISLDEKDRLLISVKTGVASTDTCYITKNEDAEEHRCRYHYWREADAECEYFGYYETNESGKIIDEYEGAWCNDDDRDKGKIDISEFGDGYIKLVLTTESKEDDKYTFAIFDDGIKIFKSSKVE